MYLLENYEFLEKLVKEGQAKHEPFYKDGLCLADKEKDPGTVYVFKFEKDEIWALYGWTKKKNKAFLKFHRQVEQFIFSFGLPVLRIGKNQDYRNHTVHIGYLDGIKVYQFERRF